MVVNIVLNILMKVIMGFGVIVIAIISIVLLINTFGLVKLY